MKNNVKKRHEKLKGKRVRDWMYVNGFRPTVVAKTLGYKCSAVSHFTRGESTVQKLANYLFLQGCPAEYLEELGYAKDYPDGLREAV